MTPELELITAKVAALGRRERALALLSVCFVLLALGFAAWSIGMVLGHYGVSRVVARQGLAGAGGSARRRASSQTRDVPTERATRTRHSAGVADPRAGVR